jgi:hypothetical protein
LDYRGAELVAMTKFLLSVRRCWVWKKPRHLLCVWSEQPRSSPAGSLCSFLELLEPDCQPVAVRPVLDPARPIDHRSGDSLEPELEEQAMMRFEQPVGNMDWEIGVDPD